MSKNNLETDLEFVETAILEGGLVSWPLANRLLRFTPRSKRVYQLAREGVIDSWVIGGVYYFSAIDCLMYGRKKRKIQHYTKTAKTDTQLEAIKAQTIKNNI